MKLYGTTAIIDGQATGAFVIAKSNDEAASKALSRLPEGGRLTHIIEFCEATRENFTRNKLGNFLPEADQTEFTVAAILEIIGMMSRLNNQLRAAVNDTEKMICEKFGFQTFNLQITEPNGTVQFHHVHHYDIASARKVAEKFAHDQYGNGAEVTRIEKVDS